MPVELKGGLLDGEIYNAGAVEAFSKLPSKIELIQMLMGTMNAPITNAVYVLNGVTTKLVRTLAAVQEKKAAG
jgi:large subunit ribosomal protein L10